MWDYPSIQRKIDFERLLAGGHVFEKISVLKEVNTDSFTYNDGGRSAAGYKGNAGDCVARAIAIASGKPYQEVYDYLANGNATQRITKRSSKHSGKKSARNGIATKRKWVQDYMISLGFVWYPTMTIGSGCKVHVRASELPKGILVLRVSRHWVCMVDGVLNDTYDCSRNGTRCVYGYWKLER